MRLKQNSTSAIVVKKTWANQQAIKLFLRDRPSMRFNRRTTVTSFLPERSTIPTNAVVD